MPVEWKLANISSLIPEKVLVKCLIQNVSFKWSVNFLTGELGLQTSSNNLRAFDLPGISKNIFSNWYDECEWCYNYNKWKALCGFDKDGHATLIKEHRVFQDTAIVFRDQGPDHLADARKRWNKQSSIFVYCLQQGFAD
jgi:hypothetical protein